MEFNTILSCKNNPFRRNCKFQGELRWVVDLLQAKIAWLPPVKVTYWYPMLITKDIKKTPNPLNYHKRLDE